MISSFDFSSKQTAIYENLVVKQKDFKTEMKAAQNFDRINMIYRIRVRLH